MNIFANKINHKYNYQLPSINPKELQELPVTTVIKSDVIITQSFDKIMN